MKLLAFILFVGTPFFGYGMADDVVTEVLITQNATVITAEANCGVDTEFGWGYGEHPNRQRMDWYSSMLWFDDVDYGHWKTKWQFQIEDIEMQQEANTWQPGDILQFLIVWGGEHGMPIHIHESSLCNVSRSSMVEATLKSASVIPTHGCHGGGSWEMDQK